MTVMIHPGEKDRTGARGSYRAGDETRKRLVNAALLLFSRQGYGATTTRQIAIKAGVAVPAIAYHFGSKHGLHLACAGDVLDRYRAVMEEAAPGLLGRLPEMAPDEARESLKRVMRQLVGMLMTGSHNESWMDFMLREMGSPGPVYDFLYGNLWGPGLELVTALIARCRPGAQPEANDPVRALLLLTELSAFSNFRLVSLKFLRLAKFDKTAEQRLVGEIEALVDRF